MQDQYELIEERLGNDEDFAEGIKDAECVIEKATIGRSDERTICLKDPTVSTLHCKVTRSGDKFIIADAGSTNGTKVNGAPLTGEHELQHGDTVQIGAFQLLFDSEDKTMTMSIQKTQTGIDINAAGMTQTIKSVASSGFMKKSIFT